jgi:hypothetical protein
LNPVDCILVDPVIAQRDDLSPSYRELSLLLRKSFGRDIDSFGLEELELARIIFAQVALMAGAALAGDSELFAGADRLWRDMQDRIGDQERVLAKHFLRLLAQDGAYPEAERNLLARLAEALDEQQICGKA